MLNFQNALDFISLGLFIVLIIIVYMAIKRSNTIKSWGRQILLLWSIGLVLCMVVALRDGYHLSVMSSTDPTIDPGVFTLSSFQSNVCMILGIANMIFFISSILIHNQKYRKIIYYALVSVIFIKILVIEISILL